MSDTPQLIIEQTSSSEHHYELMALAGILTEGLGLREAEPYLKQVKDELHAIRVLMEQSFAVTESLRQEAQQVLDAHTQSAQEYLRQIDEPVPVDYHPFESMPAGTAVRDLPDGGRLFVFSDGAFLRVHPDGSMHVVTADGDISSVSPATGGKVTLPDGKELTLLVDAVTTTHEAAGIEGLPSDVTPVLSSDGRYTMIFADGTRLDVLHRERLAVIANTGGTVNVIGIARTEGIGEEVQVRLISGGAKSFRYFESGHAGMIEADGTIHLSLASGSDLVIQFPEYGGGGSGDDGDDQGPAFFSCQGHDE